MSSNPVVVLVLVLASEPCAPEVVVPAGFTAVRCASLDEVRAALAGRGRALVVVVGDGRAGDITAIRAHAPRAAIVAVADGGGPDVDALVAPGRGPGELCRALRYLAGEPVRRSARVACAGTVTVAAGAWTAELELLDVSDDGVRVRPAPPTTLADVELTIAVDGEHRVQATATELRRDATGAVVLVLVRPTATQRAALRGLTARISSAGPRPAADLAADRILGRSPAIGRALDVLARAAPTDATVLVVGETGTGKELAARRVHDGSGRARGPFVAVNCAALPEALVESELFGHEPGAFTGALKRRIGRIELAHTGTLFLDEIGDLPAAAQAKLLRALQERVIERVGGTESIRVDFRLIAATNRDLAADIATRAFRRDLFYRLSVISVRLPPLRERTGDIGLLAHHFLAEAMRRIGKRDIRLTAHALARMEAYPWPGNVRELENLSTRLVALASSGAVLGPEHLELVVEPDLAGSPLPSTDLRDILEFCEREIVRRMLDRHGGSRTRTAAALGISRQALQTKLVRYGTGAAPTIEATG